MIEEGYSVNVYFPVVFDINLEVTLCSLLLVGGGFPSVPAVFLLFTACFQAAAISAHGCLAFPDCVEMLWNTELSS